jgi:hypothetical protein
MANIIRDVVFRVQPKINFWFIGPLSQVLFEIAIKQATDLYLYAEIQDKVPRNPNQPIRLYTYRYEMMYFVLFCFLVSHKSSVWFIFPQHQKRIRHYFLILFSTALNREKSHLACESIEAETRFVAQPLPTENIEE